MSDLIVVGFADAATAFEMRAELLRLQKEYLLEMEDVVVVTQGDDGRVQLHQPVNMTAIGAVGGGFWGMFIGMLFLNPLLGAAIGAGAGALSGSYTDIGVNDDFMQELGRTLKPGGAAVFVLVRKIAAEKLVARLGSFKSKGHVMQTSLNAADEASLRALLDKPAAA